MLPEVAIDANKFTIKFCSLQTAVSFVLQIYASTTVCLETKTLLQEHTWCLV